MLIMFRGLLIIFSYLVIQSIFAQQSLTINNKGYFEMQGLNVTVFSDIYPDGHQTGVTVIQHGVRTVANGDLRLEVSPGQWSPMPKGGKLTVNKATNTISQELWYPDSSKDHKGFNPIIYPDLQFKYNVAVTPLSGSSFKVTVNLDETVPEAWIGKMGFNLELFPGHLFGKSFNMDGKTGLFPIQPNGPLYKHDPTIATPLATGNALVVAPEEELQRLTIESNTKLELWDGRTNHNNGWYIVRSAIPAGKTDKALEWVITPHVVENWKYKPVIHISQVGYHPKQEKYVLIEVDDKQTKIDDLLLYKITPKGKVQVKHIVPEEWGQFLRYKYLKWDFTEMSEEGMYQFVYGESTSNPFQIDSEVYDRHVWQPTLEYYLPVQMCHMRVNEKYRVWHGHCHKDDALMAPIDSNHFDGYVQGTSTLTGFKPLSHVGQLNAGGWHDAGDYDLRVESQIGTIWNLALMVEEFGLDYDATLIDQKQHLVEIHVPDGKSDALQQIEHGLLSVLGAYREMGRLYRGIICSDLRQYTLLGDASVMTDNLDYNASLKPGEVENGTSGTLDDRLVFTEDNPNRELFVAAGLAAASRVLKATSPELSEECLTTARAIWDHSGSRGNTSAKVFALSELILATGDKTLIKTFVAMEDDIINDIPQSGWAVGHVIHSINDKQFKKALYVAVKKYQQKLNQEAENSPFGVPYEPNIWGAGWTIQRFGRDQYFFYKGWPELTSEKFFINALNFVLGVHPGENTMSFVSGVGSKSATVAYGVNRADWSFIPGGVISGTALIRPDLPELKIWPFFWQQTEYVMGGGATNYMFLALAVQDFYKRK